MAKKSNKVVNAGIGYTIGNIFIKGVSFLTIPLYTRLMATGIMASTIHMLPMWAL